MTYAQSLDQLKNSKFQISNLFHIWGTDNVGFALYHFVTDEIVISPLDDWKRVFAERTLLNGDNEQALKNLDLFNDKLEVVLIKDINNPTFQTLTKHLADIGKRI